MPRYGLSKTGRKMVEEAVDELMDKALARFIGHHALDKRIIVGVRPELTLPGIFFGANAEERTRPDEEVLAHLESVAKGYLDAVRAHMKPRVVKAVDSWLKDAASQGIKTTPRTVLQGELAQVYKKVASDLERIVDTESTNASNMGVLDGIERVNRSLGIDDPTVYFVVVRDTSLCEECRRLHLLDNEITPRVWKLSEISHAYHKAGEPTPSIGGLHPHCRCSLMTLMPGYGFGKDGMVKFISPEHDEFKAQRE